MCDEAQIPYDCEQVASKLQPVIGEVRRLFVRAVATGTVFEVIGVETYQAWARPTRGPLFVEDVYLLARRVPPPIADEGGDETAGEAGDA
jgi:hypothetical protein